MNILAIESSCDETAVAVVQNARTVLSSQIASQAEIHSRFGGVVPEIASRKHIEVISQLTREALAEAGVALEEIDAVAVTFAPGLIGALLVGVNFAKGLCAATGKPLIATHHLRGHIASNYLAYPELKPPFLCLIVSGGHSHIVQVEDYTRFHILGQTRDDAVGEAFDKVARVLGLPYPGGVQIDKISSQGKKDAIAFPRVHFADAPYDFSFSGLKTAVINYVHKLNQQELPIPAADIAASFQEAACSVLIEKLFLVARERGENQVAICGGVCANTRLRALAAQYAAEQGAALYIPPLSLCGDNAAMIGCAAFYEYMAGNVAQLDLNARATLAIDYTAF